MALVAWMEMKEMEMDSMDGAAFVAPHMVFHQNGAILSTPHSRFGMTWMEAKKSRNSKRSTPSSPSRGFAKTKKVETTKKEPSPAPTTPVESKSSPAPKEESDEDREFRERYLSAEKETQPDWKQQMDAAKTREAKFKTGLQVGDFKTSYSILFEEFAGAFLEGDKERLDSFLEKLGIPAPVLLLIQLVVIGVPFAGITYAMGLWK